MRKMQRCYWWCVKVHFPKSPQVCLVREALIKKNYCPSQSLFCLFHCPVVTSPENIPCCKHITEVYPPFEFLIKRILDEPPCYILQVLSPFKEGLMLILNKLFGKQVKSFHLLLDQDPFIFLCSLHNIKYIRFTKSTRYFHQSYTVFPQFVSFPSNFCPDLNLYLLSSLSKTGPSLILNCAQLSPFLRAQALQSGLYSAIVKHLDIYYGIKHILWL